MKVVPELLLWTCLIAANKAGAQYLPPTGGNLVVCYYRGWNDGTGPYNSFQPEDLDPELCTHIIYGFAFFGANYDFNQDIGFAENHARLIALKNINPNIKVILGTGKWMGGSTNFEVITKNQQIRMLFARKALAFLRENDFDGLELNWEHPTFREGGTPQDKNNYVFLAEAIRNEFEKEVTETGNPKLQLFLGVPGSLQLLPAYDLRSFNLYVDFINIFSYDYNWFSDSAKHHSPLYDIPQRGSDRDRTINVNYTMSYMLDWVDPRKLILGIPAYGRSRTLTNPADTELGAKVLGVGERGPYTGENGFLAYFEICLNIKDNGWTVVDGYPPGYVGPHAFKGNQWVSYDNENMVRTKARYAKQKRMAGVMFWTVGYDDFLGYCDNKKYPLITAAKEELNGLRLPSKRPGNRPKDSSWSSKVPTTMRPSPTTPGPVSTPSTGKTEPSAKPGKLDGTDRRPGDPTSKVPKERTLQPKGVGVDEFVVVDLPHLSPFMTLIVSNSSISISIREINVYNK